MLMLFVFVMFVILLLVSLDGQWGGTHGILRRLARRGLGAAALLVGGGLTAALLHVLAGGVLAGGGSPVAGSGMATELVAAWPGAFAMQQVRAAEVPERQNRTPSEESESPEADEEAPESDAETPEVDAATPEADAETPEIVAGEQDAVTGEQDAAATESTSLGLSGRPGEPNAGAGGPSGGAGGPKGLSLDELEPLPRVEIPYEDRPEWVESESDWTGDVHRVAISAGPYQRKSDCMRALDREKLKAVAKYVDEHLGTDRASTFIRFDVETIDRRLIREGNTHDEIIQVSLGPMHQVHALLEFDPEFREELDASWRDVQSGVRLAQTGLGAFGVLALLAVVFGYFKLDTATRGYYSFKLQILATLAILALIATGVLLAGWIPRL